MSEDFKKEEKKKKEKKVYIPEEEKGGKECPNCHAINELEAKFCAECGYNFEGAKNCPKCGAKILSPNADICEVCGEWLLQGKCKFCYADIEEGAVYCGECCNLLMEITCPKCKKLSHFEFCEYCGNPLTPRAKKVFKNINNDSKEFKGVNFFENSNSFEVKNNISKNKELVKMKAYIKKVEKKEKKKEAYTPLFSEKQKESIKSIEKIIDKEMERQEEERKRQEEERRKKEEEIKKKLAEESKKQGTIFLSKEKIKITVRDENCILDDAFWLYVNDKKIGYINHPTGRFTSYDVNLVKGINKIELKFDHGNGCGTGATININEFKMNFGGSVDHVWMVVNQ